MSAIKPGTKFRSTYADGNPEWTVVSARGSDTWDCEIKDDADWKGTKRVFGGEEIRGSIQATKALKAMVQDNKDRYSTLKKDQVVHYHNGFGEFVRCTVVMREGHFALRPDALVGAWRAHDLPRRLPDGTIRMGYHAQRIQEQNPVDFMTPHSGNIWELSESLRKQHKTDPATLPAIDLSLPGPTPEELAVAAKWDTIKLLRSAVNGEGTDPDAILNMARYILGVEAV